MTDTITHWLDRHRAGDDEALDRLFPLIYHELRKVAHRQVRGERPDRTLSTTALVHETYLKLNEAKALSSGDRSEFLAAAAVTMRRILVDAARQRLAVKRGGGVPNLPLDALELRLEAPGTDEDIMALNQALLGLGAASPRAHQVVELRFFTGLSLGEVAEILDLSVKTVQRDWITARAWLQAQLAKDRPLP